MTVLTPRPLEAVVQSWSTSLERCQSAWSAPSSALKIAIRLSNRGPQLEDLFHQSLADTTLKTLHFALIEIGKNSTHSHTLISVALQASNLRSEEESEAEGLSAPATWHGHITSGRGMPSAKRGTFKGTSNKLVVLMGKSRQSSHGSPDSACQCMQTGLGQLHPLPIVKRKLSTIA